MTTKRDDVDMSPEAVARRLAEVRDLYRLAQYLGTFRKLDTKA